MFERDDRSQISGFSHVAALRSGPNTPLPRNAREETKRP